MQVMTGDSGNPHSSYTHFFRHNQAGFFSFAPSKKLRMKIITSASNMADFAAKSLSDGATIGFVPTMGALHQGHISLVRKAIENNDIVVVSVFVNPTQFNQKSDLENYPRNFEADKAMLKKEGIGAMFFPTVEEIYPNPSRPTYNMDGLDQRLEGPNRPGHFNGVVQVVTRFFDIIRPTHAYFGEKDFQQLAIIKHMTTKLGYATRIVGCPTLREQSGLAMSSRNMRLSAQEKITAEQISHALYSIKSALKKGNSLHEAVAKSRALLTEHKDIDLEYLEPVNPNTLQPATHLDLSVQVCVAAWVGQTRLIDNLKVK